MRAAHAAQTATVATGVVNSNEPRFVAGNSVIQAAVRTKVATHVVAGLAYDNGQRPGPDFFKGHERRKRHASHGFHAFISVRRQPFRHPVQHLGDGPVSPQLDDRRKLYRISAKHDVFKRVAIVENTAATANAEPRILPQRRCRRQRCRADVLAAVTAIGGHQRAPALDVHAGKALERVDGADDAHARPIDRVGDLRGIADLVGQLDEDGDADGVYNRLRVLVQMRRMITQGLVPRADRRRHADLHRIRAHALRPGSEIGQLRSGASPDADDELAVAPVERLQLRFPLLQKDIGKQFGIEQLTVAAHVHARAQICVGLKRQRLRNDRACARIDTAANGRRVARPGAGGDHNRIFKLQFTQVDRKIHQMPPQSNSS